MSRGKFENVTLSGRSRPRLLDVSLVIEPRTAILGIPERARPLCSICWSVSEQPDSGTITSEFQQPPQLPAIRHLPGMACVASDGRANVRAVSPELAGGEAKFAELLAEFNLSDKIVNSQINPLKGVPGRPCALWQAARVLVFR